MSSLHPVLQPCLWYVVSTVLVFALALPGSHSLSMCQELVLSLAGHLQQSHRHLGRVPGVAGAAPARAIQREPSALHSEPRAQSCDMLFVCKSLWECRSPNPSFGSQL